MKQDENENAPCGAQTPQRSESDYTSLEHGQRSRIGPWQSIPCPFGPHLAAVSADGGRLLCGTCDLSGTRQQIEREARRRVFAFFRLHPEFAGTRTEEGVNRLAGLVRELLSGPVRRVTARACTEAYGLAFLGLPAGVGRRVFEEIERGRNSRPSGRREAA